MKMEGNNAWTHIRATRLVASVFGVLAGIGGITHGIGESLQGNVAPAGLIIDTWTQGPIADRMGGDPAMTLVPNLLATGLLTLLVSLAVLVWAAAYVERRRGGWVLILLSIAMMLVGGGFGPPIVGILAGVAGTASKEPSSWWRAQLSGSVGRFLARLWPWVLAVSVLAGLFLFVGATLLVYLVGWGNSDLYLNSFYLVVVSLLLAIPTAMASDVQSSAQGFLA
jgi:MFS family permease